MADTGAPCGSGEASVSEEGNILVKAHSGQNRSGVQHFPHAGTAFGALVADNDYITLVDLFGADGFDGFIFRIEYPGRAGMYQHFFCYGTFLDDRTHRRNVSRQYGDTSGLAVRIFYGTDYIRASDNSVFDQGADGLAGDGLAAFVNEAQFTQFVHDSRNAACFVQVDHMMEATGAQFGQVRCLFGNFVEQR